MSYAELYKYCQGLPAPISRRQIIPKVVELAKRALPPKIMLRTMDPAILAGFIVWPGDTNHPFAQWAAGRPLIVIARAHNYCWQRFVVIKEVMHYFDLPLETVSSPDDFEALIAEFSGPQPDRSVAMDSEVRALWMALGVVCPEELRQDFARKRLVGEITDLEIATALRIPLTFVPHLFHGHFKQIIADLCDC